MAKKAYTVLILTQQAATVKKLLISTLTLKIAAALLSILVLISAFIVYDYGIYRVKVADLYRLRAENYSQQEEIRNFMGKMTILEDQLRKLAEMEKKMERDLKEVGKPKKLNRASFVVPGSNGTQKVAKEVTAAADEQISILEEERSQLISCLHQDLSVMRKQAWQTEKDLKDLEGLLRARKSILMAMPSMWPVPGQISSRFGDTRISAYSGGPRPHRGLDISAPAGTPIVAPADGVISLVGTGSDLGRLIIIDHGHGFSTRYGHLKKSLVQTGEKVRKGQTIGTVGSSGTSTGPHLHYEVRVRGSAVDPMDYMKKGS